MPWNAGVNSKTGECCDCAEVAEFGPCADCGKDEPKPPCQCPPPYYTIPSECEADYAPCYKCVSAFPCDSKSPGTLGSFGCYEPELKTCQDYGACADCLTLQDSACYKVVDCSDQPAECPNPACCREERKTCSDYGFLNLSEAQAKCGEEDGNPLNCINIELPACQSLTCYSCKLCADFGLSGFPFCKFPEVPQSVTKCGQTCYDCVDPDCNCEEAKGYFNSPPLNTDPNCLLSKSKSGVLPFPCGNKLCYYMVCSNCSDQGLYSEEPSPPEPCYKYEEKSICDGFQFDSWQDECDREICFEKVKRTCSDFASNQGTGNKCAKDASECDPNEYFEESEECLTADPEFGGCSELDGECKGICKEYCGWKIIGGPDFETTGTPSCTTTPSLSVTNSNCTSGSAASVASNNISGFFTVTCPPGDPCEGKVPSTTWPPGPGFGGGSFSSPTTVVTFSWEDCGISPGDGVISVTLERCKECA